jgi:predicted nucleic acid-binding protein
MAQPSRKRGKRVIVVDVNVVAYLFIVGDKTDEARRLVVADNEWWIPLLWRHEFLNVVATYIRHGGISVDTGKAL